MYTFYNAGYLYALIGLLALIGISVGSYFMRRKAWRRFVPSLSLRQTLMPNRVGIKRIIKDVLLISAIGTLIIALARPQTAGSISKKEDQRGIEAMICIDVSNSMLSSDIAPSRISFAKRAISKLLEGMKNDKVGIVVFAGEAYMQLPITNDLRSAQEYLQDVMPNMLSAQGTDIAKAIELAHTAFSERKDIGKSIIIITDGEDHEGGAEEAAKEAKASGIKLSVVGVGTEQGGIIPLEDGQGYLKDDDGQVVTTTLNSAMCMSIAEAGGGSYIHTSNTTQLTTAIAKDLDTLPKATIGNIKRAGYIEHYMPWIATAIILLLAELIISQRRNNLWHKLDVFGHAKRK